MKVRFFNLPIVLVCAIMYGGALWSQSDFEPKLHVHSAYTLPYNILYPPEFKADKKYPLLLFLHGAGERGDDNQSQLAHFHELFMEAVHSRKFPAIVVFPQCPKNDYWANANIERHTDRLDIEYLPGGEPTNAMQSLLSLMDSLSQLKFVDTNRIYAGGLSMGGMGTFELLYRRSDMFAAAFPICGGAHPATASAYAKKVKLWIFHGMDDQMVLAKYSEDMVKALESAGGHPKFTLYDGVKHDSWKNAREEEDLLPWLFSQRRYAPLRLHSYIGSSVIFQRGRPIPIDGTGMPGASVEITWRDSTYHTTIDESGLLSFHLPREEAGGPYTLAVSEADTTIFIENILIGDVWFASGQSNMEWPLEKSDGGLDEMLYADFDQIRFLMVPRELEFQPVEDWQKELKWETATGRHIGKYSGVAYFFAKRIHQESNIPIGIIDASWGGTRIETWMSESAIEPFHIYNFELNILKSRDLPLREWEAKAKSAFEQWKESEYKKGIGLEEKWYERQADLSAWKPIQVPGYWEDQISEYADFDGAMWYRKSFEVPKDFLDHDIRMWLSQIDDHHICWINGQYIGETYFSKSWTNYLIPAGILKEYDNEIVLRVFDIEGKGGLTGLESYFDFYPDKDDSVRAHLNGTWLCRPGVQFISEGQSSLSFIGNNPNYYPTLLYNGMVHPYRKFPIKGVIWYQGEGNRLNAYFYRRLFSAMIADWRMLWENPEMPFYFVQLANYGKRNEKPMESETAELRASQMLTRHVPYTGMAATIDIGDPSDIHPTNKKEVGERLARHALKNEYHQSKIITDGPVYKEHIRKGNKLIISFDNAEGLHLSDGRSPLGFEIATGTGDFLTANAKIVGDQIEISHPSIQYPVHVRYAWADAPEVNLMNREKLPAYPFRTDQRVLITQDRIRNYK